jgi:hypothetical protein
MEKAVKKGLKLSAAGAAFVYVSSTVSAARLKQSRQ